MRKCENCKYNTIENLETVCNNEESPLYSLYTENNGLCEDYEERGENRW